jgi:hypothetical protein
VSLHKYLYAKECPISFKDPSGKMWSMSELSASFGIAAMIAKTYANQIAGLFVRFGNAAVSTGQKLVNPIITFTKAMRIAKTGDFSVPKDMAAFYSSGGSGANAAEALESGLMTIEKTPGGRMLIEMGVKNLYRPFQELIWRQASIRFAEAAEGIVTCFVKGAELARTFYSVEFPILTSSSKVTRLIFPGLPPGM